MKSVTLIGPAMVTVAGKTALRRPYEGDLIVTNKEAARLVEAGVLAAPPAEADGDDPIEPDPVAEDA